MSITRILCDGCGFPRIYCTCGKEKAMRPEQKAAESLQRGTLCDEEPKEYVSRVATIIRRANAEHYGRLLRKILGALESDDIQEMILAEDMIEIELAALEGECK